jgi:pyruvate dehydrogenase E2 component (dihydrolipoamide acetyltransferase)
MYAEEGVLSAWLRPSGAHVEVGEAIAEITTEKVTFEIPSSTAGILHHVAETGAMLRVEQLLGYILAAGEALPTSAQTEKAAAHEKADERATNSAVQDIARAGAPLRASPVARRLAHQHGVDLSGIKGSGPGGRIVEADVLAKVAQQGTQGGLAAEATEVEED